jgi:hypothetical protein
VIGNARPLQVDFPRRKISAGVRRMNIHLGQNNNLLWERTGMRLWGI